MKMKSNDHYAISTPLGIFYKDLDKKALAETERVTRKEQALNEQIFINSQLKKKLLKEYNHDDLEAIKANTNHSPIKN